MCDLRNLGLGFSIKQERKCAYSFSELMLSNGIGSLGRESIREGFIRCLDPFANWEKAISPLYMKQKDSVMVSDSL